MLNYSELKKISNVEIINPKEIGNKQLRFYTDTRIYNNEEVFIAIEGENFKPLSFISDIKAEIIVCEENDFNRNAIINTDKIIIFVESAINSLREVANLISKKFQKNGGCLIAISGSNGKTTTKEMLFHLLSEIDENTECTKKNNNNHIGVPLTLFQIQESTKYCIVELGSNHPGEIKYLVDMIEPSLGICTNIGETHLEFFESVENVLKEEGYLLNYLSNKNRVHFVNADDDYLSSYCGHEKSLSYGVDDSNDYVFVFEGEKYSLKYNKINYQLKNDKITGRHNQVNMLVSVMIASYLGFNFSEIERAVESFVPTQNRSQWIEINNKKVFLDAYNANPSSMRAAITGFKEKCNSLGLKKEEFALILGDMNELGNNAAVFHEELGKFCAQMGILNLYFVGNYAHSYNKGCNYIGTEFLTTDQLKNKFVDVLALHKALFIKGSRSLQLESTVDITLC